MFKSSNTLLISVLSLVVIVAIGGLIFYVNTSSRATALTMQEESLRSVGNLLAKTLEGKCETATALTRDLAGRRTIINALSGGDKEPALQELERTIQNAHGEYAVMFAFNLKGQIVVGANLAGKRITKGERLGREYVKAILEGKDFYASSSAIRSRTTGKLIVAMSAAVKNDAGQLIGGVGVFPDMSFLFDNYVTPLRFGENGYAYITDTQGVVLAHPDKSFLLKNISHHDFIRYALKHKTGSLDYTYKGTEKFLFFREIPYVHWIVGLTANHAEMAAGAIQQSAILLGAGVLLVLMVILITSYIARRYIFSPFDRIRAFVIKVSEGDYDASLEGRFQY